MAWLEDGIYVFSPQGCYRTLASKEERSRLLFCKFSTLSRSEGERVGEGSRDAGGLLFSLHRIREKNNKKSRKQKLWSQIACRFVVSPPLLRGTRAFWLQLD